MRLSFYQPSLLAFISFFLFLLWPLTVANDDFLDDRVRRWCDRLNIHDESGCADKFRNWCREHKDSKRRYPQCDQLLIGDNEVPTTTTSLPTSFSPLPEFEKKVDSPKAVQKVQKVSKTKLNGLKGLLNQAAQGLAANVRKLVELGDVFAPKPLPKAEPTHTELVVNDPELYYEGDVDLTTTQFDQIFRAIQLATSVLGKLNGRHKRKVSKAPHYQRWPQPDKSPIPYQFDESVPQATQDVIDKAVQLWQDNTCVRWRKNGPGNDRVEFTDGSGCSSFVGRAGGVQQISLRTPGCDTVGIASHEIGHSLGFFHEQNRPDQEQFVTINYPNVQFFRYNNFVPQTWSDVEDEGERYDYGSVMHYDGRTKGFAINPDGYTIIAKDPNYQTTMGQRRGPSFIDFKQVNRAYCKQICKQSLNCQNGGYEDPNRCDRCKCPDGFGGSDCSEVAPSSCGGSLQATSEWKSFSSPNYPDKFPANVECNWLIKSSGTSRVVLEFTGTFDFECKDTCINSYVEVKRGPDFDPAGYRLCCNIRPSKPIKSAGNLMAVMLRTWGNQSRGFSGRYKSEANPSGNSLPPTNRPGQPTKPGLPGTPAPTYAPVTDCRCTEWSSWGQCNDQCGGCGRALRQRQCENVRDCHDREERICNVEACGNTNGFAISPGGKVTIMNKGCCLGLFNTDGFCKGLTDTISDQVTKWFSGIGNGKK